ncbi:MAG TPA: hypothetical protein VKV02_02055 [Acidobacteriaceae bacterium]|nr:hypothetical protein [Acidobacteriaceae bacterium]
MSFFRAPATLLAGALVLAATPAFSQTAPAAVPADGITMDMMPISPEQIATCRQQATAQLSDEQDTLHKREHGQDNDKMKQGAITGVTGAATSAISRGRNGYGWWGNHNNNGAQTAAATGATQRTERNSDNVASTTATSQQVGTDAYSQCIAGIKGPEYIHFRQTGRIEAFSGSAPAGSPTPAMSAAAAVAPAPPSSTKPNIQDTGDGKHFVLTPPGQTEAREVTLVAGTKNQYIEEVTGDKYIVMPDGSVTRIAKHSTTAHK